MSLGNVSPLFIKKHSLEIKERLETPSLRAVLDFLRAGAIRSITEVTAAHMYLGLGLKY